MRGRLIAGVLLAGLGASGAARADLCGGDTSLTYAFTNYCAETVWLGARAYAPTTAYPPEGGNWAMAASCETNGDCPSGACDQESGQCTCTGDADCGGAPCQANGKCATTANVCLPETVTSGTFWPRTGCVLHDRVSPTTLTCVTGACSSTSNDGSQLLDCSIANGGGSPKNPVAQFEVTTSSTSLNYDVSIAAGFNVETAGVPVGGGWVEPGTPATQVIACLEAGCTGDLNASCPANLRFTAPGGGPTIGCLDPCTACANGADIGCDDTTGDSYTDCDAGMGSVTNRSLYCAKNTVITPATLQYAQASPNQGTATAFGQADCAYGTTFTIPEFESGYALPAGQGVCLYLDAPQGTIPHFNDYGWADAASGTTKNCGGLPPDYAALPDGTPCGGYLAKQSNDGSTGYANGLGYTCQTVKASSTTLSPPPHLCMPPTTNGLGQCVADSRGENPLYTAVGGVANASWIAAGIIAGGGTTPYYATFKDACPHAYAWQYDDLSSGFGCDPTLESSPGSAFTGFDVTFCGSRKPAPGPKPAGLVVALATGGAAKKVGTSEGKVKLAGAFTVPSGLALDQATLSVHDVLDEVGGAGELTDPGLVATNLVAEPGSTAEKAVYVSPMPAGARASAAGTRLKVKVRIKNAATGEARYSLAVVGGALRRPERCSTGRKPMTRLETTLGFAVAGQREIVAGGVVPWRCGAKTLRRKG
jgi:hypothetical protein